jgi:hypothetical protein
MHSLAHVDDASNAVASLHVSKGLVDLVQRLTVSDELVNLERTAHVVVNEARKLGTTLDSTEGATLPDTTSDKLESYMVQT